MSEQVMQSVRTTLIDVDPEQSQSFPSASWLRPWAFRFMPMATATTAPPKATVHRCFLNYTVAG